MSKMMKSLLGLIVVVAVMTSCKTEKDYLLTIKTPYGDMKAILYEETPLHKENFVKLVKEGFYDSLLFHRVIKDFMIQGGDPNSKGAQAGAPLGSGGPGYQIPAEFNEHLFHEKGALSAARTNNPKKESSGSQFYLVQGNVLSTEELTIDMNALGMAARQMMENPDYDSLKKILIAAYEIGGGEAYGKACINMKDEIERITKTKVSKEVAADRLAAYTSTGGAPHLDDLYTVFGKVVEGLDVIDKIAEQATDPRDRPVNDIIMAIDLEEISRKEITKNYGYQYPVED